MTFGETLRQVRLQRGLTQRELADRADSAHEVISRLEHDLQQPVLSTIQALAKALGVTPGRLVDGPPKKTLLERAREDPQLVEKARQLRQLERMAALTETVGAAGAAKETA